VLSRPGTWRTSWQYPWARRRKSLLTGDGANMHTKSAAAAAAAAAAGACGRGRGGLYERRQRQRLDCMWLWGRSAGRPHTTLGSAWGSHSRQRVIRVDVIITCGYELEVHAMPLLYVEAAQLVFELGFESLTMLCLN